MSILVLGMHRSGTSTVTGLIRMMGAYVARPQDMMEETPDNPKGYWERNDVRAVNDALLAGHGCTWDELSHWTFEGPFNPAPQELRQSIGTISIELEAQKPWVLKDPRLSITYPYWDFPPNTVCVLVHRDPLEIARSLKVRDGIPLTKGLALWEYYTVGSLRCAEARPIIHVSYNAMLADPLREVSRLHAGLMSRFPALKPLEEGMIRSFISESLNRSANREIDIAEALTPAQLHTLQRFTGKVASPEQAKVSFTGRQAMQDLAARISHYGDESLENQYRSLLDRHEELARRHASLTDAQRQARQLQSDLEALRESESWRVGNRIVRMLRTFLPSTGG